MATATSDKSAGLRGRFWLKGNPEDEAISGRLFLVPGSNPLLELDGQLTPVMEETDRRKLPDGTEVVVSSPISSVDLVRQSLDIHGTLETGEDVTLPAAFTAGWTMGGSGYNSHRLQAFYAICGDHVDGAAALFTRVRVRIRHLDAWARLPGFSRTLDLAAGKKGLAFDPPEVPPATLASGAQVTLDQVTGWIGPDVAGGRVERTLWINVEGTPPVTYRDLGRTIIKPLMNLLALSVSAECPVVEVEVSTGADHPWLAVHSATLKPAAETIISPRRVLLPLTETGLNGVAKWLDSVVRLGPLPSVVARAAGQRDDPLETQLLEMTTATEGLHRLLLQQHQRMTNDQASEARDKALEAIKELPDDVRDAVRSALQHLTDQSYPRRLLDLADHVGQAVPGVTGITQQWKKRVTATRVGFAHALEHGFLDEDNAEEAMTILQSIRWLLTGLLLLQTGIEPAALGRLLNAYEGYQMFLEQARVWLPAVYETPAEPAQ
jgi:hypothetical protein